jgi:hypothetical protein
VVQHAEVEHDVERSEQSRSVVMKKSATQVDLAVKLLPGQVERAAGRSAFQT